MRKITCFFFLFLWSSSVLAFSCTTSQGAIVPIGGGSSNLNVPLSHEVGDGANLVIDLSNYITCKNDSPRSDWTDLVYLTKGTTFSGALQNFSGTITFNGGQYDLPYGSTTSALQLKSLKSIAIPMKLYLTPLSKTSSPNNSPAGGVAIQAGSLIASIIMNQSNTIRPSDNFNFVWNIYALNDVVVPTATCDVDSRNVTVNLPNYPATQAIPISVHCAKSQLLSFYLSGTTANDSSIFKNLNEGTSGGAAGVGTQVVRNSSPISTGTNISLGQIGSTPVDLGLTARYALTSGQVTAGSVQSIVNLTFVYQ